MAHGEDYSILDHLRKNESCRYVQMQRIIDGMWFFCFFFLSKDGMWFR